MSREPGQRAVSNTNLLSTSGPLSQTSNSSLEVQHRMFWAGHDQDSHVVDCLKLPQTQSLWLMTYLHFSLGDTMTINTNEQAWGPTVFWWGLGDVTGLSCCLAGYVVTCWAASHCRDILAVSDTAPLSSPLVPDCPTSTGGWGPGPPTRQVAHKLEHLSHSELFLGDLEVFPTGRLWETMIERDDDCEGPCPFTTFPYPWNTQMSPFLLPLLPSRRQISILAPVNAGRNPIR